MDLKDVAAISYEKAFNKKWWESKRAMAAHGSGTSKALDEWQKKCKKPVDQMNAKEVQDAEDTCVLLSKCLKVAMTKCGDKQKETTAACKKYLKLVADFEILLSDRSKKLSNEIANVIVTLDDFRAKTITPSAKVVSTLAGALAQERKRVQELQAQADKATLDKDKEYLLQQIASERKTLLEYVKGFGDVTDNINKAAMPIDTIIKTARKDPRFRTALVEHEKHLAAVETSASKFQDAAQALVDDVEFVRRALAGTETADDAIRETQRYIDWFTEGTSVPGFEKVVDEAKEIATALVKEKDPATLPPKTWDQIDEWERQFTADAKQFAAAFQEAERFMAGLQLYAKQWKDEPEIQKSFKQGSELYNTFKRQLAVYDKLNAAIRTRINEMNKQRK
jgi:hypothetical protein